MAIERLFAAKYPDLSASTGARNAELAEIYGEWYQLWEKAALKAAALQFACDRRPNPMDPQQRKWTLASFPGDKLLRLRELDKLAHYETQLRDGAAAELRAALAQVDLEATLLSDDGCLFRIKQAYWLGRDGLTFTKLGRLHGFVREDSTLVDGIVLLDEHAVSEWVALQTQADGREPYAPDTSSGSTTTPRRLAVPNIPGGGRKKFEKAKSEMMSAVRDGKVSFDQLRKMAQKKLADICPTGGRTMLVRAREAALQDLSGEGFSSESGSELISNESTS